MRFKVRLQRLLLSAWLPEAVGLLARLYYRDAVLVARWWLARGHVVQAAYVRTSLDAPGFTPFISDIDTLLIVDAPDLAALSRRIRLLKKAFPVFSHTW